MLQMKITMSLLPRRNLYALDVYSGVVVILEVYEGERQTPLRKELKIIFLCSQIRQTYGGDFREKMFVLLVIETRSCSAMANHITVRVIRDHQI
jgi:hypothetical protein